MGTCGPLAPSAQSHLAETVSSQAGPRGSPIHLCTPAHWGPLPLSDPEALEVLRSGYILGPGAATLPSSQCCVYLRRSGRRGLSLAAPGTAAARLPPTPPQSLGFRWACSAARTAWPEPPSLRVSSPQDPPRLHMLPPPQPCSLVCLWLLCRGGVCRMVCVLPMDTQSLWATDQRDRLPGWGEGQVRAELWPPWPAPGKG